MLKPHRASVGIVDFQRSVFNARSAAGHLFDDPLGIILQDILVERLGS